MFEYTVFCLFVVLCVVKVDSKVCSKQITVNSVQIVSYVQTYTELFNAICENSMLDYEYNENIKTTYKCLKIATKSKLITRYQPKMENKTEYSCCSGYFQIDDLNSLNSNEEDINCKPICHPPCQNGLCVEPQKCLCLPGYITTPDPNNQCLPVCDLDCGHGICIKPNTCKCFTGYELTNTGSHAVCTKIQNKEIECFSGYIKSVNGICLPKCSNGCTNGICISPEVCKCNSGFHLGTVNFDEPEICIPDCNSGYKKIKGICLPECRHSCGNGTCILPNVCECFRGYKIDITKFSSQASSNGVLCIPSCKGVCAGECIAPNTCITSTTTAPSSKTATSSWTTSIPSTTTRFTTNSTTSRSIAYWWTTPRTTTTSSTTFWRTTPTITTSTSTSHWWATPQTTTSRSTPYWRTNPRPATFRSTSWWTTPRTTPTNSTPFWRTTPRITTSTSTSHWWPTPQTTTSRSAPYWKTNPRPDNSRSTSWWITPRTTTSRSSPYWRITPRPTTSRSTSWWTTPRTITSRSSLYRWTTPQTTTSSSTPYWPTTPRTTTSRSTPYWSTTSPTTTSQSIHYWWTTPRTNTSSSTPNWWTTPQTITTPRSTTSWSTTPVLPSLPTTQQHTEINSTKTATINLPEGTHTKAQKTWVEQYWALVFLPVLLLLFAILVMIILWLRKPITIYLRGRSYVVEDDVLNGYNTEQRVHYSKRKDNVECK